MRQPRRVARQALLVAALSVPAAVAAQRPIAPAPGFLYVWGTAIDTLRPAPGTPTAAQRPRARAVLLATVDLRAGSPTRGRVVDVLVAADSGADGAHHTEHGLAPDGILFANDFGAGRTYRFDLRTPGVPRLLGAFDGAGPLGWPHSFVRLADGDVLATWQRGPGGAPPGGVARLHRDGAVVRWARAAAPGVDSTTLQPYSLEVIPALDRVVTTSTSMVTDVGVHVQVWRLSDLALLHTLEVPPAPAGDSSGMGGMGHAAHGAADATPAAPHHLFPGEPRLLADGHTVMLGTFTCGLYVLTGLEGTAPRLRFVRAFPGMDCAVPARVGRWWVQTVPGARALVALDVSRPLGPREVSRLAFPDGVTPHWLAADASGTRLVMTSGHPGDPTIHLVRLDPRTGALAPDAATPTIDLSRVAVPGLGTLLVVPHGSVFGPAEPSGK